VPNIPYVPSIPEIEPRISSLNIGFNLLESVSSINPLSGMSGYD
jgi:hypothetical protein